MGAWLLALAKYIYYSYYIAEDIKSDIKTAVSSTKLYVMASNIAPSNTTPVLRPNLNFLFLSKSLALVRFRRFSFGEIKDFCFALFVNIKLSFIAYL